MQPTTEGQQSAASLTLSRPALSAVPGETGTTTATVHNGGTQVEQFALQVIGPTAPWSHVEPPTLTVYPNGHADCTVRLSPPRHSSTAPGLAWFTLRATSVLHPGLSMDVNGTLEVGTFREVAATLDPQGTTGRWRTTHSIELTNDGNLNEPVAVRADDPAGRLRFRIPAGEVVFPPGKHRINVPVRPPLRLLGKAQRYPFQVTVAPRQPVPPIRLDGNREGIALVAGWVAKLATVLVLVAVAAGAVTLVGTRLPMFASSAQRSAAASPAPAIAPVGGVPSAGPSQSSAPPSPAAPSQVAAPPAPPASPSPSAPSPPAKAIRIEAESLLPPAFATAQLGAQPNCCNVTWSGNFQVWFGSASANKAFVLKFSVDTAASYLVVLALTTAPDYGIVTIFVDDQNLDKGFDGYSPKVAVQVRKYAVLPLKPGSHSLTVSVTGKNPASTNYAAGLDYIELDR